MTKLFSSLRLAMLAALSVTTLASCELYFGDSDDDGGGGGNEPGFACGNNADCAAGCYCGAEGTCEEAGFCTSDEECADGFVCDERNSCVPSSCSSDAECDTGEVCDNGTCTATCVCTSDSQAQDQLGTTDAYCDESRETCHYGADPAGTCAGAVTCNEKAPKCDEGTVPLVGSDGCYTGECRAIAQCGELPACEAYQHETDCGGAACTIVSTGINCTKPDGTACQSGDAGCTCEDFRFNSCETPTAVPEN